MRLHKRLLRTGLRNAQPLQIKGVTVDDTAVSIALVNTNAYARVHVFASRYEPAYGVYDYLGRIRDREPWSGLAGIDESFYAAARTLGDEYRYIIDRRYATKFPGNMLERPSLLLNPWPIRTTETGAPLRRGFQREEVLAVIANRGRVERADYLRLKVRYFSDGAILGSREFVEELFQTQRHRFGPKRSSGARRLRGLTSELYSVRDLQKNVFS